jgi:hypothetical protein
VVTRIGRPLVVRGTLMFGLGAVVLVILTGHDLGRDAALVLAPALFVMGLGSGAVITPNQALSLMEVDPLMGGTAGGVLQTAQRIGLAVGQAVVGAVFFAQLHSSGHYGDAITGAVLTALAFVSAALLIGLVDLARGRRSAEALRG